jgi:NAD(P)-dependent dehydrogenase (short-subunit alcohol dehydrogenase family)
VASDTTPAPGLLTPLRLKQHTQPAPGVQQLGNGATVPTGDVLKTANAFTRDGAQSYARMPDVYPDFPYRWISWADWESKVRTMVQARVNAGSVTNVDGWELWNEPDWTWDTAAAGAFNAAWVRTYQAVRALDAVTPEYWERCVAINQRAAFFAIQAVVPGMKRLGGGSIVNLGSTGWQTKTGGYPVYATAKSSVNGLTRGLARELGAARIRVNVLTPGWVMTERQVTLWLDEAGERELARNQCLPDKVMPEDIARMALFLASDEARAITAQEFVVDAGWT